MTSDHLPTRFTLNAHDEGRNLIDLRVVIIKNETECSSLRYATHCGDENPYGGRISIRQQPMVTGTSRITAMPLMMYNTACGMISNLYLVESELSFNYSAKQPLLHLSPSRPHRPFDRMTLIHQPSNDHCSLVLQPRPLSTSHIEMEYIMEQRYLARQATLDLQEIRATDGAGNGLSSMNIVQHLLATSSGRLQQLEQYLRYIIMIQLHSTQFTIRALVNFCKDIIDLLKQVNWTSLLVLLVATQTARILPCPMMPKDDAQVAWSRTKPVYTIGVGSKSVYT